MADVLQAVLDDLRAEGDDLDALVADLDAAGWATATPADGWTIKHQVAHLASVDRLAELSVARPDEFAAELQKAFADPEGYIDAAALEGLALAPAELLAYWRAGRSSLVAAIGTLPRGVKAPWFGPPMSAATVATGRIMETWAHGQDVADALGIQRKPTARLQHVALLGVKARAYGYMVRDLPVPTSEVRVELTAPDGSLWTFGPPEAASRVTGPALDFCLLVTRRRHRDDLALTAVGDADLWLDVAQSYAGPPGPGREPGSAA